MNRSRGFTLIELMVAVAIVAVIGAIAITGLNTVISQQEIAMARAERWREIQMAMRMIMQDLSEVHPRETRDESGTSRRASFLADPGFQFGLEFSRGGWTNPTGLPRGTVLRVAYDIEETTLVRFYWPVADRTYATPPGRMNLLTGVESMQIVYLDGDNEQWREWPPQTTGGAAGTLTPRAVEIELTLEDLGTIYRLIEVGS